jgi:hypothetical protein
MWKNLEDSLFEYHLFEKKGWTVSSTFDLEGPDKRQYIESCKRDVLLFNIDYFCRNVKDKLEVHSDIEAHKKVSGAVEKFIGKDLKTICKNLLKGKPFLDALSLIDGKEMRDEIIKFCENESKTS